MIVGSVCLSHSPLLEKARASTEVERAFNSAIIAAGELVAAWRADIAVVIHPDHFNGFFYGLMPAFCVGVEAESLGDWGTVPGKVAVPSNLACSLGEYLIASGIDTAISHRMLIDHGAAQPLAMLSEYAQLDAVIPVFINCAAPPRPSFARVRALGLALGEWAQGIEERVVLVGSGGLSHDPPMMKLHGASAEVRERIISGRRATVAERSERQRRIVNEAMLSSAGRGKSRPLNPDWDRAFLNHVSIGDFSIFDAWSDEDITADGGAGAHEVRTWIATLSALSARAPFNAETLFYSPVPQWLTGMAVMSATPIGLGKCDEARRTNLGGAP